jgi:hypothetical protein
MTTVIYYQNKENPYKFIELHNDGHYHNSVKQFISKNGKHIVINPCYRMKKKALMDLLKDYEEIIYSPDTLYIPSELSETYIPCLPPDIELTIIQAIIKAVNALHLTQDEKTQAVEDARAEKLNNLTDLLPIEFI